MQVGLLVNEIMILFLDLPYNAKSQMYVYMLCMFYHFYIILSTVHFL